MLATRFPASLSPFLLQDPPRLASSSPSYPSLYKPIILVTPFVSSGCSTWLLDTSFPLPSHLSSPHRAQGHVCYGHDAPDSDYVPPHIYNKLPLPPYLRTVISFPFLFLFFIHLVPKPRDQSRPSSPQPFFKFRNSLTTTNRPRL